MFDTKFGHVFFCDTPTLRASDSISCLVQEQVPCLDVHSFVIPQAPKCVSSMLAPHEILLQKIVHYASRITVYNTMVSDCKSGLPVLISNSKTWEFNTVKLLMITDYSSITEKNNCLANCSNYMEKSNAAIEQIEYRHLYGQVSI